MRGLAAALAFGIAATLSAPAGAGLCGSFAFQSWASLSTVHERYGSALFLIRAGNESGTAFLIDSDKGLFLTARHVIADDSQVLRKIIKAWSGSGGAEPLRLRVRRVHPQLDVAILEAEDAAGLKDIRAYELAFDEVASGTNAGFAGMAFVDGEVGRQVSGSYSPSAADGEIAIDGNDLLMRTEVQDGDSGAPVVTRDGRVIGLVLERKYNEQAKILPLSELTEFLLGAGDGAGEGDALQQLLNSELPALRASLNPQRCYARCITNLELLHHMAYLARGAPKIDQLQQNIDRIRCPLVRAAIQRGIADLAVEAQQAIAQATPPLKQKIDRDVVQQIQDGRALAATNPEAADRMFGAAEKFLRGSASELIANDPESFLDALCERPSAQSEPLRQKVAKFAETSGLQIPEAVIAGADDHACGSRKNGQLARTLQEVVYAKNLKTGDPVSDSSAISLSSMAALLATDINTKGIALESVGNELYLRGDFVDAAATYGSALEKGYRSRRIKQSFDFTKALAASDADYRLVLGEPIEDRLKLLATEGAGQAADVESGAAAP